MVVSWQKEGRKSYLRVSQIHFSRSEKNHLTERNINGAEVRIVPR
jgi:hypothetical protein